MKFTAIATVAAALLFSLTGCVSPSTSQGASGASSGVEVFGTIDAGVSGRR